MLLPWMGMNNLEKGLSFFSKNFGKHPKLLFSSIQGQTSGYGQYSAGGFFELFGVSLYSYAIPYLFQIPASVLNIYTLEGKSFNLWVD